MRTINNGLRLSRGIRTMMKYVVNVRNAVAIFIVIAIITLCLTLLGGRDAFAQGPGACAGDIQQFCQGVQQGGGRIVRCLVQNKQQLSPGCKIRIAEVAEQIKEVHQACEDDILTFCPAVKPGGGRIAQCLKANKAYLSFECKAKIFEEMP
ncbi:MAG: cysteine rich repeat-containing protein [Bacteroidota bacterium]